MGNAKWPGWHQSDPRSEFEGGGVQENTIYPKSPDALQNGDRLRLISITGQEADVTAPPDPYFWYGGVAPEEVIPGLTEQQVLDAVDPYSPY